jgi:hypothetical protein
MDSDDERQRELTPEVYEQFMWPEIRNLERHFRRSDRLFFASYVMVVLTMTTLSALNPPPWSGFFTGAAVVCAFTAGHVMKGVQSRRAGYRQLEELHKDAELILLQREVES